MGRLNVTRTQVRSGTARDASKLGRKVTRPAFGATMRRTSRVGHSRGPELNFYHRRFASFRRTSDRAPGQAIAEFALVWPIFVVVVMALLEFGIAFNNLLTVNYAARNSALLGAEAGDQSCADVIILNSIEKDTSPPANRNEIQTVLVYYSDRNGNQLADGGLSGQNTYSRNPAGAPLTCTYFGTALSVPYQLVGTAGYPYQDQTAANTPGDRCVVLKGCTSLTTNQGTAGHTTLDTIGVRIIYRYSFVTPLSSAISLLQGSGNFNGGQWTFTQQSVMRMEPIL